MTKVFVFLGALYSSAAFAGLCYDNIVGGSYLCTVKYSNGTSIASEISFQTPGGSANSQFEMSTVGSTFKSQCSCVARGSFTNPKFSVHPSKFSCGSLGGGFFGKAVSRGRKLKLELASGNGSFGLGECLKQ